MGSPDQESEDERWRRNFGELLQELRVAQAGVQILFAFLLTLPFQSRFTGIDTFEKAVYLIALLSAAASAAMIIAPVAFHRALFRLGEKPALVRTAHWLASGGLVTLLISMVSSVLLVTDVIVGRVPAMVVSATAGVWFLLLWVVLPITRRASVEG